jgi:hypothetical protein
MRSLLPLFCLALSTLEVRATVPQRPEQLWEGPVVERPRREAGPAREMPAPLGPFCWLREYEQISDFLAVWQVGNPASPNYGGMIEAEAGPLGGVIQTDNTLEAIWVWSKRRAWTGRTDRDANIAAAWTYCTNYPAWAEEGAPGDNYYRAHNCAWALGACREYEAATGDTTRRAYARTCAAYIAQHPLPLPANASLNALVTGWCAGSLYEHAVAVGREDWRAAALEQGLDLLDWVEANPAQWLAWDEWAMSGGTILWGLCRSVFTEAPLYGQHWLPDHVFHVPDWTDWHNVAGYDWDSSWNVAYANGLFAVQDATGDPVSAERARRITEGLLSLDTDDDGGIMADSHDPDTEDMSWVTCYLARFGLARLIGQPPVRDAAPLRLHGLVDEEVVVQGQPRELAVIVANHGLEAAAGVTVSLEVDGVVSSGQVDLDFADLDTLVLATWTPVLQGRHRIRAWTSWTQDGNPANDTLAVDLIALSPPLTRRESSGDDGRLRVEQADWSFRVEAPATGPVRVVVYNLLGQQVLNEMRDAPSPGWLRLNLGPIGTGLPAGLYLARVETGGRGAVLRVRHLR